MPISTANACALFQEDFTTVKVEFPENHNRTCSMTNEQSDQNLSKEYTYKVPKAWDVQEGDILLVQVGSRNVHNIKVVKVTAVHEDEQIDYESDKYIKWAIAPIDFTDFDERMELDLELSQHVKLQQKKSAKQMLRDSLALSLPESLQQKLK